MKKLIGIMSAIVSCSSSALPFEYDVYTIPEFVTQELSVQEEMDKLRSKSISEMNDIIFNECAFTETMIRELYQTVEMEHLNPSAKKLRHKTTGFHWQRSAYLGEQGFKFPMGIRMFESFEKIISHKVANKQFYNESNLEEITHLCKWEHNPKKYELIFSKFNGKVNLSGIKNETGKSLLPLRKETPPLESVFVSKTEIEKLMLSKVDLLLAKILISEDIKIGLASQNRNEWMIYKHLLDKKYNDFMYFIENGGSNDHYSQILGMVLMLSLDSNQSYIIRKYSAGFYERNGKQSTAKREVEKVIEHTINNLKNNSEAYLNNVKKKNALRFLNQYVFKDNVTFKK
ncbi:hypothetical protein [Mannheimia haemolytica]|uniref:hypothetical protein n=1 Tax=Mannheimia haemolytica TaxID=75985 RepID=UPI00115CCC93|nr:hypothetical protein [Mannheimia haemolytica]MDW0723820.1 hypothetical protein [Mannheimia haemolytica]MDW0737125.1 hypothetical protein [Mannheimia haemolytica]TRC67990.1 hypothetical protein FEA31_03810 [Mannheimia haemolytica]